MRVFNIVASVIFMFLLACVVFELHGIKQAIIAQDVVMFDNGR